VALGKTHGLQAFASWHTPIDWREDVTAQAEWRSSNPAIATVSSTGKVTGHAPGTVTISVTFDGVRSDATMVVGGAKDSLTVTSAHLRPTLRNGRDYFAATVYYSYTLVSDSANPRLIFTGVAGGNVLSSWTDVHVEKGAGTRTAEHSIEVAQLSTVCVTLSMQAHDGSAPYTLISVDLGCHAAR
jgi:hypothetical protein